MERHGTINITNTTNHTEPEFSELAVGEHLQYGSYLHIKVSSVGAINLSTGGCVYLAGKPVRRVDVDITYKVI